MGNEGLILIIQIITLTLVSIQSIPQILTLYQQKKKASQNLSLKSWIFKTLFSVFFVATLFLGTPNVYVISTQIINLLMAMVITFQVWYYQTEFEIIPKPVSLFNILARLEEHEIEHTEENYHLIPILHNILKQIYVFKTINEFPKLLY